MKEQKEQKTHDSGSKESKKSEKSHRLLFKGEDQGFYFFKRELASDSSTSKREKNHADGPV